MYEDLNKKVRYKNEKEIRIKLAGINIEKGKINSVKFNIRKKELSNKLETILRQKREIKELEIRKKYQASNNNPTPAFYQAMAAHRKSKMKI